MLNGRVASRRLSVRRQQPGLGRLPVGVDRVLFACPGDFDGATGGFLALPDVRRGVVAAVGVPGEPIRAPVQVVVRSVPTAAAGEVPEACGAPASGSALADVEQAGDIAHAEPVQAQRGRDQVLLVRRVKVLPRRPVKPGLVPGLRIVMTSGPAAGRNRDGLAALHMLAR
jgi:hypothetical protein